MAFRCTIGLHAWNQDIPVQDRWPVKSGAPHVLYVSRGIQKAVQYCKKCRACRIVFREPDIDSILGQIGSTRWSYCSPKRERLIDSLPPL